MIKDYFGLSETAFTKSVLASKPYRSQAWQELSARLDHIVKNHALGVITDEVGDPPKVGGKVHRRARRRQFDHAFMDAYENQGKQPVLVIDEAHLLFASMPRKCDSSPTSSSTP